MTQICVIDDSPVATRQVGHFLVAAGMQAFEVFHDAESGLKWCLDHRPSLVLLDYSMPGMDGLTFLKRLSAGGTASMTKTVIVTGWDTPSLRDKAFAAGASEVMAKPLSRSALEVVLKSLLAPRIEASADELAADLVVANQDDCRRAEGTIAEVSGQADMREVVRTQELILKTRQAAILASGWLCADRSLLRALVLALAKAEQVPETTCAQLDAALHRLYRFETLHLEPGSGKAWSGTRQASSLLATLAREALPLMQERPSDVIQLCAQMVFLGRERWDGLGEPFGLRGSAIAHLAQLFSLANRMANLMAAKSLGGAQLSLGDTMRTLHAEAGEAFNPELLASLHDAALNLGLLERAAPASPAAWHAVPEEQVA